MSDAPGTQQSPPRVALSSSRHALPRVALSSSRHALPRVAILLATHNGEAYLLEQLASILDQEGVDLTVVVSDDASQDRSRELLASQAARDSRIRLLEPGRWGSPAKNFYRLLTSVDPAEFDYIGFADQDDIWLPGKLARHAALLQEHSAAGISSNVTAFEPDGARTLVRKDYPQRLADYLFETPGPGSTYLLRRDLALLVQEQLLDPASPAHDAPTHDSLVYALARAARLPWLIDPASTVDYRQHGGNAVGANVTWAAAWKRLTQAASGQHRRQAQVMADACLRIAHPDEAARLAWFRELFAHRSAVNALRLARRAGQLRRRPRDRCILAALILAGIW